jgi:hypothetical protein
MSTATGLENAGRMSFGWTVAVIGTGLLIAALVAGLLLQRGRDELVRGGAEVAEANLPEQSADYGIRQLQKSDVRTLDAAADYGVRHLNGPVVSRSQAGIGELDPSVDYGIRLATRPPLRLQPEADYGIRHPQRIVRPFDPEDDYGVRHRQEIER